MDSLIAFAIILVLIAVAGIRYRLSPFFTMIGGAVLFGLLTGSNLDTILLWIVTGIGRIVSALGILIFCGAIIARILRDQHYIEDIVSDIRKRISNPEMISGLSGYILSIPLACCITGFLILSPVLDHLGKNEDEKRILLYLAATGGVISFVLIYPTPVLIPLFLKFGGTISPVLFDAITIPLSLLILAGVVIAASRRSGNKNHPGRDMRSCRDYEEKIPSFHPRAWTTFIVMLVAIPIGFLLFGLSSASMVNFVMLAGAVAAILTATPKNREQSVKKGAMHGGLIIFDICGAGAFGYVILQNGLAESILNGLPAFIPVISVPFLIAALLATAQGSRVVTAVITADLISGTVFAESISPIPLILSISAGACIISFVTDPFFWLVQHATGDDPVKVTRHYTLPIAFTGIIIFIIAAILEYLVFWFG